jgi:hypothetical protein
MGKLQWQFLAVHRDVLIYPVVADLFDLLKLRYRDGTFVREVKAEFRRCDERTSLIDVIAENFSKSKV